MDNYKNILKILPLFVLVKITWTFVGGLRGDGIGWTDGCMNDKWSIRRLSSYADMKYAPCVFYGNE